jgi:mannose-6-phosphate isomerase-like protein (cupin superfamily)
LPEDPMRFATIAILALMLSTQAPSLGEPDKQATHIPSSRVAAAFVKGEPLLETASYKVHASRREAAGKAEVHLRDTDIIYVLEGTATILTGGGVVGGATTATDEIRGSSIEGGVEQQLVKGDVFIVPNGVPHRFTRVEAPFRYYVVKATTPEGGAR